MAAHFRRTRFRRGVAAIGRTLVAAAFVFAHVGVGPPSFAQDAARLAEVMPGATRVGVVEGEPPAAPAYRGDELLGYVFHTREVVASVGYSGKPLDVLVGLGLDGRITGASIIEQHEPILVIGVAH